MPGRIRALSRCGCSRKANGLAPYQVPCPGPCKGLISREQEQEDIIAAHFPHILGHGHGAPARWVGVRQQREHVPVCRDSGPPHGSASGLAAHRGAGARRSSLSWHLQGRGGRKCPPGMGSLILVRPGLIQESQWFRAWGKKSMLGSTDHVPWVPIRSLQERGAGNIQ